VRDGREVLTGIFKQPIAGRVRIETLGVEGDGQADPSVHGGPDKAVYAYSFANTSYWREALERPDLGAGAFGENLTVADLPDSLVALGDVLRVGEALLQVT
jgi:MOSC domain-containing protein YiiM